MQFTRGSDRDWSSPGAHWARQLEDLVRQLHRHGQQANGLGVAPWNAVHLWEKRCDCPAAALSESREPLGPSRGSAPQSRSGREGKFGGRVAAVVVGAGVGGGVARCSSSVMGVPVILQRQVPAVL